MRMHSYGKCTPNVIVGALLIFSLILLYNFWNVSTINHDLGLKIHNLEQQLISLSKNNDALQSNLEKVHDEKGNLQITIQKEDSSIKALQVDLENARKKAQSCKEESNALLLKTQSNNKDINELKSKVVSLQAQITEKNTVNERLEKEFKDTKESLEKEIARLKLSTPKPSVAKPGIDISPGDQQPVLLNDPAVPHPNGWMDSDFSARVPHINLRSRSKSLKGIIPHNSPVIILDDPSLPKAKARFSVVDPPKNDLVFKNREQEMKPDLGAPGVPSPPLKQPDGDHKFTENQITGDNAQENLGVLPVPGQHGQQIQPQGNLDAQEDDGDRPMKEDLTQQDDQSPDGALSQKEKDLAEIPPPAGKPPSEPAARVAPLGGHSAQDVREAAHNPVGENPQELNNV